jgi:hypothetical protein
LPPEKSVHPEGRSSVDGAGEQVAEDIVSGAGHHFIILALLTILPAEARPAGPPPGSTAGDGPPCLPEFLRLRNDVETKARTARPPEGENPAAGLCKFFSRFADAEERWTRYTESNAQSCRIPVPIVSQLTLLHANIEQARHQIGGGTADPGDAMLRGLRGITMDDLSGPDHRGARRR